MLEDHACVKRATRGRLGCRTSCTGLYADVNHNRPEEFEEQAKLDVIMNQYSQYKSSFAKNLKFDPNMANLSIYYTIMKCNNH